MENKKLGQETLEAHVSKTLHENNELQKDTMNGLMKSSEASCSYENKEIVFDFPIQDWQVNRVGTIHGGIICTAFDLTIAALARFYANERFAPTVSLDVKFIRPASVGDVLVVSAKAVAAGRRISHLVGEATRKSDGKLVATAASIYMNVDTTKERKGTSDAVK